MPLINKPPINADERRKELDSITEKIIGCVYKVSNTLGSGFLEKVYENALAYELRKCGMQTWQQHSIQVKYDGTLVGEFAADLLIEEKVIIELKAAKALDDAHMAQCLNYLKATGLSVCLLVNFGKPKVEIKRIVRNF
ncbi:MAG: GxxExxY protein [Deltaproteobacteria bacterium]|nr:MAG: GxxExxY protein [Deltaproteobacteria bacterium]